MNQEKANEYQVKTPESRTKLSSSKLEQFSDPYSSDLKCDAPSKNKQYNFAETFAESYEKNELLRK